MTLTDDIQRLKKAGMSELDDVQTTVGVIDGLRARIAELEAEIERLKGQVAAYSDILDPTIEALAPDAVAVFPMTSESIDVLAERISSELTERVEEAEAEVERLNTESEKARADCDYWMAEVERLKEKQ